MLRRVVRCCSRVACAPDRASIMILLIISPRPPSSTLFPYTTLFRSCRRPAWRASNRPAPTSSVEAAPAATAARSASRSEEHTSELQSHVNLVCRLLLAKKKLARRTGLRDGENAKYHHDVRAALTYRH